MADVTTIKVPKALRDRIAADAEGLTAQAFLQSLIETHERNKPLAAVAAPTATPLRKTWTAGAKKPRTGPAVDADGLGR
jgi:hypothetical protein